MQSLVGEKKVVLASESPRRQALLRQMGLTFVVEPSNVDEESVTSASPTELVTSLSHRKAQAVARSHADALVIGADTVVVLDAEILGKPKSAAGAAKMLSALSGREHQVFTGFTLYDRPTDRSISDYEVTTVRFRKLGEEEILAYVRSGSPMDKAGGYGIQDDYGAVFVDRIEGCFYNVVGFPLTKFYLTLQAFYRERSRIGK